MWIQRGCRNYYILYEKLTLPRYTHHCKFKNNKNILPNLPSVGRQMRRDFILDEFYFNFNLINFYLRRNFPSPGAAWVKSCQGSIYYLTITILIGWAPVSLLKLTKGNFNFHKHIRLATCRNEARFDWEDPINLENY